MDATGRCVLARLPVGAYEVVFERWVDNTRYEAVHSVRVSLEAPGTRISVVMPPQ